VSEDARGERLPATGAKGKLTRSGNLVGSVSIPEMKAGMQSKMSENVFFFPFGLIYTALCYSARDGVADMK
jgi:hypothetical protein